MKANPEWKPEIYDLNLDKVSTAVYDADGYAVTYKSKNVERALMALDVLKNDPTAGTRKNAPSTQTQALSSRFSPRLAKSSAIASSARPPKPW